jgi:hypothetical protein
MKEYNPNASVDFAAGLQNAVNSDINAIRTYNSRANQVDSDRAAIADQPLDALLGVLQFSKTLKDQFKAREERKLKKLGAEFDQSGVSIQEMQTAQQKAIEFAKDQTQYISYLEENYPPEQVKFLSQLGGGNQILQQKFINQQLASGVSTYVSQNLNKPYTVNGLNISFNGAKTDSDRKLIYNRLVKDYSKEVGAAPSKEIYAEIWKPLVDQNYTVLKNQAVYRNISESDAEYNKRNTEQILSAVKHKTPNIGSAQFALLVQNHASKFGGNVAAAFDDLYNNTLVKQIEDGQISRDEYYNFISGVIDHKGSGIVSIERGFGKKLRTTYLNEQFRKQELAKQKAAAEFRKAKVKQAEQAVVEQFTVQINDGTFNKKSALVAKEIGS